MGIVSLASFHEAGKTKAGNTNYYLPRVPIIHHVVDFTYTLLQYLSSMALRIFSPPFSYQLHHGHRRIYHYLVRAAYDQNYDFTNEQNEAKMK